VESADHLLLLVALHDLTSFPARDLGSVTQRVLEPLAQLFSLGRVRV
jgi:hypothetical protein